MRGIACVGHIADGRCDHCGSMSIGCAIELMKTPGTRFSGSDWKYGFPHKFYLNSEKFYAKHLLDATIEEFQAYNELSFKLFQVSWERVGQGDDLKYTCPRTQSFYGWQRAGMVSETGEAVYSI